MSFALDQLLDRLSLEQTSTHRFTGQNKDIGGGRVFGGQTMAQAVYAAIQTVPTGMHMHSLHNYFLSMGKADEPVEFVVTELRNGRSFSARDIKAMQGDNCILSMMASFQIEENGFEHDTNAMPTHYPKPDTLEPEQAYVKKIIDEIPKPLQHLALEDKPFDLRAVYPVHPITPQKAEPHQAVWLKTNGKLPDDPALHATLLTYATDFKLCTTSLRPYGYSYLHPSMQVASIDHALWLHKPVKCDEWLLYVMHSPHASNARGFNTGEVFDANGTLIASVAQEGLIRQRKQPNG